MIAKQTNRKKIMLLCVIAAVLFAGPALFAYYSKHNSSKTKEVYDAGTSSDVQFGEPSIHIPQSANSDACNRLPRAKVEKILQVATNGPQISIPDTKNNEGQVSGCTFIIADDTRGTSQYLSVVRRMYDTSKEAIVAYNRIKKQPNAKLVNKTDLYFKEPHQYIALKDNALATITLVSSEDPLSKMQEVAKLL